MERVVAVGDGGSRLRPSLSTQTRYCPLADARSAKEFNGLHPLFTEEPPNDKTDSDGGADRGCGLGGEPNAEDSPRRRRCRYASLPGESTAERGLSGDLLR